MNQTDIVMHAIHDNIEVLLQLGKNICFINLHITSYEHRATTYSLLMEAANAYKTILPTFASCSQSRIDALIKERSSAYI